MAPTTVAPVVSTNFSAGNTNKATPALTWADGDLITVWGLTGDNSVTLGTPTAAGLTFVLQTGYPTSTASRGKVYLWLATAVGSGSQAIACTQSSAVEGGIIAQPWTGHGGIGALPTPAGGTTGAATVSMAVTAIDSAISMGWVNWNQNNGARTYRTTNLGTATERSYYSTATWATGATATNAATTATGAQSVGMTAPTLDAWLIGAVEILTASTVDNTPQPGMASQFDDELLPTGWFS